MKKDAINSAKEEMLDCYFRVEAKKMECLLNACESFMNAKETANIELHKVMELEKQYKPKLATSVNIKNYELADTAIKDLALYKNNGKRLGSVIKKISVLKKIDVTKLDDLVELRYNLYNTRKSYKEACTVRNIERKKINILTRDLDYTASGIMETFEDLVNKFSKDGSIKNDKTL